MNRFNNQNRFLLVLAIGLLAIALILTIMPSNLEAQTASRWTTEFYDNGALLGTPVHRENVQYVAYNWGNNAPANNVPADGFSMTMNTQIYLNAANYRFYMRADDGATVTIDDTVIIDTYQDTQPDNLIVTTIPVTAGLHNIRIDYRDIVGPAFIYFSWQNAAINSTVPNFAAGPNTGSEPIPIDSSGEWTAEYFANRNLQGFPTAIINEPSPSHNWRANAPLQNLPTDNFSVRWSTARNLTAGNYQIDVEADDGVRVYVDNVAYIDEWHLATAQRYTTNLSLDAGVHNIVVEYYEATGLAYIDFALTSTTNPVVNPPIAPNAPQLTVQTTGNLNVRNAPNVETGDVLFRITRGQTFPVVGRTADSSWWQINVNGRTGWVSGQFVNTANIASVPVTNNTVLPVPELTEFEVRTAVNLNMRDDPTTNSSIIDVVPFFSTMDVVGRNIDSTWAKVYYDGLTGWVSTRYLNLVNAQSFNQFPVVFD